MTLAASLVHLESREHRDHIERSERELLEAGLAIARRSEGLTFIALPAPVVSVTPIVDAFCDEPLVSWASEDLVLAGVGVARELRGRGPARWATVIAAAHAIATNTPEVTDEPRDTMPTPLPTAIDGASVRAVIDGIARPINTLGSARPRFIGGAAFAPGAADRAPWSGFGDAWFDLPRWTYSNDRASAQLVLAVDARAAMEVDRWRTELDRFRTAFAVARAVLPGQPALVELARAGVETWRTQVTNITAAIARGACTKIVAARTCTVVLAGPIRAAGLLASLDDRHADCVRVMIKPPTAAALIAATPERLVCRDRDLVLCDALAGSIARSVGPAELLASAKDRREHAIVVDAIRRVLADAGAEVSAPTTPAIKALRHVLHLHTPFRAILRSPRHVLALAASLHPTPAVGGTPSEVARDWIAAREPVARGWYAAPVGWFDFEGNGELAVALRCGLVTGNRAQLWAGAGIVEGSDPERELAETEIKLQAMLGALGVTGGMR